MPVWLAEWLEAAFLLAGVIGIGTALMLPNSPRRAIALGPITFGMTMGHLTCKLFANPSDEASKWTLLLFSAMGLLIGLGFVRKLWRVPAE